MRMNALHLCGCFYGSKPKTLAAISIVAAVIGFAGCSDPRFQAKQSVRDERIHFYSQSYLRRESESPGHLRALSDERKSLGVRRDEHLHRRLAEVERHEEARAADLRDTRPVRHERIHSILRGKPENVHDPWAKMTY